MTEPLKTEDGRVYVRLNTGNLASVPQDELTTFLENGGGAVATQEDLAERERRRQYGEGLGNELAAFGESALSGATLGLSDMAAKAISDDYAEGLLARREFNPNAAMAGEVVGTLAPILATGGTSALAKGVATVGLPARGLVAAGEAATGAAARLLGAEAATGILGQAVRTGAAYGVGGAVEGALYGAAKAVADDYLTDQDITAERVIAGAGTGAIWGGGLGGALGTAGGLLTGTARKARDFWNRTPAQREAVDALDDALRADASAVGDVDGVAGASGDAAATGGASGMADAAATGRSATGATAEAEVAAQTLEADQRLMSQVGFKSEDQIVAELSSPPPTPEQQALLERVKSYASNADAAKAFKRELDDEVNATLEDILLIRKNDNELEQYVNRGQKKAAARDLAEAAPPDWTPEKVEIVTNAVQETIDRFNKMRADPHSLQQYEHAALKDAVEFGEALIDKARGLQKAGKKAQPVSGPASPDTFVSGGRASADDIAEFFDIHDKFKTAVGRAQAKIMRASGGGKTPGSQAARREYMLHRALLEDESLYGKGITEMQRVTNAAESEAIRFRRAFDQVAGLPEGKRTVQGDGDTFDVLAEGDTDKIRGLFMDGGRNLQDERIFALGIQRQADLSAVKSQYYRVPDQLKAKAAESQAAAERIVARYKRMKELKQAGDQYEQALTDLRELPVFGQQLANLKLTFGRSASVISDAISDSTVRTSGGGARATAAGASDTAIGTRSGSAAESALGVRSGSAAGSAVRAAVKAESKLAQASKGVVSWLRKAGDATARAGRAVAVPVARGARAKVLLGVALAAETPASYERLIRNASALQDPESTERKSIRANLYPLRAQNPRLADAIEAKTQAIGDFLAQKAGELSVQPRPGDPFGHLRKVRHDPAKAKKMARYVEAATDPQSAIDRIASGEVLREDIEALQALYPRLYQRVVENVLLDLAEVDKLPPYEARLKLGHILNAPTDPSMRPEYLRTIQEIAASGVGIEAERAANGPMGEPSLSPGKRREPRLTNVFATTADLQSVQGSRLQ